MSIRGKTLTKLLVDEPKRAMHGTGVGKRIWQQRQKPQYDPRRKHLTPYELRPHAVMFRPYAPPPQRVVYRQVGTREVPDADGRVYHVPVLARTVLWDLQDMTASGRPRRRNGARL